MIQTSQPTQTLKQGLMAEAKNKRLAYLAKSWPLYLMLLPGFLQLLMFHFYPMYGSVIAFENYNPGLGFIRSPWVGLDNFKFMLLLPDFYNTLRNTLIIAVGKIVTLQLSAIILALMLNEIGNYTIKRITQTVIYLPYFLSWIVMGGILVDILSPVSGIVNRFLITIGLNPIMFLGDNRWFVPTLLATNIWKNVGWSTIIYLAALTGIDPVLHEAAAIDGANRWQRIVHVTLPGISSTVILVACLNLGSVLDAGFDQVLNLYNVGVYATGDILDTWVYRAGLISAKYSLAAAVGLLKSVIGMFLIVAAYRLADRFSGYRIF